MSPSAVHGILCAVHFEHDVTLDAQSHRILQTVRELATTFQARVAFLIVISGLFGSSTEILRKSGKVINAITDTAKQMPADLIVVGRTRPETLSLGAQTHVLKIDHAARCAVLSVR